MASAKRTPFESEFQTPGELAAMPQDKRDLALEREASLVEDGWTIRRGWDTRGPFQGHHSAGILDHLYRMTKSGRPTRYVSEPYQLYEWDDLLDAHRRGWDIHVDTFGIWNPGETVRIIFTRGRAGEKVKP